MSRTQSDQIVTAIWNGTITEEEAHELMIALKHKDKNGINKLMLEHKHKGESNVNNNIKD